MGGLNSRFIEPEDAYVGDMVFRHEYSQYPMFHGPLEFEYSTCPYCRRFFFHCGELPFATCDNHVSPRVHAGA